MTKCQQAILIAMALWASAASECASALPSRHVLPVAVALNAASAALADCASKGFHVSVAIVDRDGSLRLLAADPDVSPISIELSQRKARTAALFNAKSGDIGARFQASPGFAQAMTNVDERLSGAQGALLIQAGAEVLGAMGISGAPSGDKDEACVATGIAAVAGAMK
jgi:uncharacterized protein GlcG (DUF336 family)